MQSPTMSARRRKRLKVTQENGVTLISLGEMEIWDGADLALIRDTLIEQVQEYRRSALAVDMRTVKYIPSGFFGMLGEWKDRGVSISIKGVQENVSNMLWFQQFFVESVPGMYHLQGEPQFEMSAIFAEQDGSDQDGAGDDEAHHECDREDSFEDVSCCVLIPLRDR